MLAADDNRPWPGWPTAAVAKSVAQLVDFKKEIEPIFRVACYQCHAGGRPQGQLRLDAKAPALRGGISGPLLVPGKSAESLLMRRVLGEGDVSGFHSRDEFTLAAWVYPTSTQGGTIIARAAGSAAQLERAAGAWMGRGYGLFLDSGKVHFNLVNEWADDAIRVETENTLTPGVWHHVLATYDGSSQVEGVQFFLNGQPQPLKIHCRQLFDPLTNNEPLRIGAVGENFERKFHGLLDEVRIYRHVLALDEIAALACPDAAHEIARLPHKQRTAAQSDKLRQSFLHSVAPTEVGRVWQRLTDLREQRRKLAASAPTVMVMLERATTRETFLLKRGAYDAPGEKVTRRHFFHRAGLGLSTAALATLVHRDGLGAGAPTVGSTSLPHCAPKAKRLIYLFQSGGPSQLDLFDPKPKLAALRGAELPPSVRMGQRITGMSAYQASLPVAPSIHKFAQHGQSGATLSELLPHTARIADQLCFIKSLHTEQINHDPAITMMTTGFQLAAWELITRG